MIIKSTIILVSVIIFCLVFNCCSEEIYDVLVLGAGMGGISAATTLVKNGVTNIAILEGTDRIGGRTQSAKLGSYTVELGTCWIHGASEKNPLYNLAVKFNLTFQESNFGAWKVFDERGYDVTKEADSYSNKLNHALKLMTSMKQQLLDENQADRSDMSVKASLSMAGWIPTSPLEQACDFYANDFKWSFPPELTSVRHLATPTYDDFGDSEMMVHHQTNAGFVTIHQHLLQSVPDWQSKTHLNTVVKSINYDADKVLVNTSKGIFTAKHVIVTFSIGVLQHNIVKFYPELPQWKQEAIAGFQIGNCVHLYLRFPADKPWFIPTKTEYILFASRTRGYYPLWQNLEVFLPGCRILQCSIMNTEADRLMFLTDREIQTEALAVLRTMFGNNIPQVEQLIVSRWKTDPFFYGAYANWPPGYLQSTHDALKAPVGRVYFAGEAYNSQYFGFLHGALLSGEETANTVIDCRDNREQCQAYVPPYLAKSCNSKAFEP